MNRKFLPKVFGWMFIGLLVTFITAYTVSLNSTMLENIYSSFWTIVIFLVEIIIAGTLAAKIDKLSGATATCLYIFFAFITGITSSFIFLDFSTTGDGQLTGAQLLSLINRRKEKLSSLAAVMKRYPQVLINVKVSNEAKLKYYTDHEIKDEIEKVKNELGDRGRVLVRVSGTEPIIRVMLEGECYEEITDYANRLADLVRERLS